MRRLKDFLYTVLIVSVIAVIVAVSFYFTMFLPCDSYPGWVSDVPMRCIREYRK